MFQIRKANGRYCQSIEIMSKVPKEQRPLSFIKEHEDHNNTPIVINEDA